MKRTTSTKDDTALVVAASTAFASILGNIALAVDRADLRRDAGLLRRQRNHLVVVFNRLQRAHAELQMRLAEARAEGERRLGELERLRAESERQRSELGELRAENVELRKRIA